MIRAKWVNGRAVPEEAVDWPEGTTVFVSRTPLPERDETDLANQDDDPESVAKWLAWYDSLEPLVFAPGEEGAIDDARRAVADFSRQNVDQRIEGLFQ